MKKPVRGSAAVSSGSDMWYYMLGSQKVGPVDEAQIVEMLSSGELSSDTLVWKKEMEKWVSANATELLSRAKGQQPEPGGSDQDTGKKPASKRKIPWWIWLIVGVVVLGIAAAAWFFFVTFDELMA